MSDYLQPFSDDSSAASEGMLDRQEHTITGAMIGIVRDAFGASQTQYEKSEEARTNDEWARLAADVVSSLPRFNATVAGLIRGALLVDPNASLRDNGVSFALNIAEGAALNKVVRFTSADGLAGKWASTELGGGLKGELATHFLAGAGFSAVRTGFDSETWQDEHGDFSLGVGVKNFGIGTISGAFINIPAGAAGMRIARLAGTEFAVGLASRLAVGATSGATAGGVYGFTDSLVQTHSLLEAGKGFVQGSIVGALSGGMAAGIPGARYVEAAARADYTSMAPDLVSTERGYAAEKADTQPSRQSVIAADSGRVATTTNTDSARGKASSSDTTVSREVDPKISKSGTDSHTKEAEPKETELLKRFPSDPEKPMLGDDAYDTSSIREKIAKFGDALSFKNQKINFIGVSQEMPIPERGTYTRTYIAEDAPKTFATNEEFDKWVRVDKNAPAMIYNVDGIQIIQSEAHAAHVDHLRPLRIGAEPVADETGSKGIQRRIEALQKLIDLGGEQASRALPEDFVHALRGVSDRSYIKTITLLSEDDIETLRRQKVETSDGDLKNRVTAANMHPHGYTTFFNPSRYSLDHFMKHEQVHRVQNRYGTKLYESAKKLDGDVEASEYAHLYPRGHDSSAPESEAEMESIAFLGKDLETFFEAADRAPARMSVLANRLDDILKKANPEDRSIDAPEIQARINYINEQIKPGVVARLTDLALSGEKYDSVPLLAHLATEPDARVESILLNAVENGDFSWHKPAAKALGRIGDQNTLSRLREILNETRTGHGDIIDAMTTLHSPDETERAKFVASLFNENKDFSGVANAKFWLQHYVDTPVALEMLDNPPGVAEADAPTLIRYNLREPEPTTMGEADEPELNERNERRQEDQRKIAAYLLGRYGDQSDIPLLRKWVGDTQYGMSDTAINSMALLHAKDGGSQFDFLLDLAKPGSNIQEEARHAIRSGSPGFTRGEWTQDPRFKPIHDILYHMERPDLWEAEVAAKGLARLSAPDKLYWLNEILSSIDNERFTNPERKAERKRDLATAVAKKEER